MSDEKRDVKTASQKTTMQEEVIAITKGIPHGNG